MDNNRKDCPQLNDYQKKILKFCGHIHLDKLIYKDHMTGTADWKPLSNTLYDAEDHNFYKLQNTHVFFPLCFIFHVSVYYSFGGS